MTRNHGRRDANHAAIAQALTAAGFAVWSTADLGHGFPDLIVAASGVNVLFEVKSIGGKLTDAERDFFNHWPGPRHVVWSAAEAIQRMHEEMQR